MSSLLSNTMVGLFSGYQTSTPILIAVATTTIVFCVPFLMKYLRKPKRFNNNKDTIILCGFAKKIDTPSPSGFCQKLETFLRVTSTTYEHKEVLLGSAPKGKLPYIIDGDKVIPDSHFIIQHLIRTNKSRDLNTTLTRSQLADSRSWQAYIEELVYSAIVWERWYNDDNIKILVREIFSEVPWLIRVPLTWQFRRNIRNSLWIQGIARHSAEEIHEILKRAADDLEARIDTKTLTFHGTQELTEIDIIIFSFFINALGTESNPIFSGLILERPKLVSFTRRIIGPLFPEYKGVIQKLESVKGL
jgi:glutathione S-transferase